ncbi:hypothetical protein BWI17_14640 [Betaproteobacteria bacterium GR16-43]|nr:hypothetical protein BWI17_14640 [Betaproteobacteria bacterium GR16-43]
MNKNSMVGKWARAAIMGLGIVTSSWAMAFPGDPAIFGTGGFVRSRFGESLDEALAVRILPDGKILVAGRSRNAAYTYDTALARYLPDGTLDPAFGTQGKTVARGYEARGIALQPDGSILVAGLSQSDTNDYGRMALLRFTSQGQLDSSFGNGGIVTSTAGALRSLAKAVALQADGKIVVAGEAGSLPDGHITAWRFQANGGVDSSFGTAGVASIPTQLAPREGASSIVVQADGRILLGGYALIARNSVEWSNAQVVVRLGDNGSLDNTFAPSTMDLLAAEGDVTLALQPNGRILAAGSLGAFGNSAFAVVGYGANGGVDVTFGNAGLAATVAQPGAGGWITGITVQADGAMVVTGGSVGIGFPAARFLANGAPDATFGNAGVVSIGMPPLPLPPFGSNISGARGAIATQADGKLVFAGTWLRNSDDFTVVRLGANGSIDPTFASGGIAMTDFGNGDRASWNAVHAMPDGRVIATGSGMDKLRSYITVARYLDDGTQDPAFGTNGFVRTDLGTESSVVSSTSTTEPDGRLTVAGVRTTRVGPLNYVRDVAWVRYLADGSLDPTFGNQGVALQADPNLEPTRIKVRPEGGYFVLAKSSTGTYLERLDANGTLVASFGSGGKLTLPNATNVSPYSQLEVQADGKVLLAGGFRDWVVRRLLADGSPDPSFGTGGIATITPPSADGVVGIALDSMGRIVVGGGRSGDFGTLMGAARLMPDGTPDPTFGNGGTTPLSNWAPHESPAAMALDSDGGILLSGTCNRHPSSTYDLCVTRYMANGLRDSAFGLDGQVLIPDSSTEGRVVGMVGRDSSVVLAIATTTGPSPYILAARKLHASRQTDHDFSGEGRGDLLWVNAWDGRAAIWLMDGIAPVRMEGIIGAVTGWEATNAADFNGDGKTDLVWRHTDGRIAIYLMNGTTPSSTAQILNAGGWSVTHTPDLNGDGKADLVFQHTDGTIAVWTMNGTAMTGGTTLLGSGTGWTVIKAADFDGDGMDDLLFRHTDGRHAIWLMNGVAIKSTVQILNAGGWTATHTPDLNGDGKADIVWQHTDGTIAVWLMNGAAMTSGTGLLNAGSGWSVTRTGDFDGDGKADLFFMHTDGRAAIYLMNGITPTQTTQILNAGSGWSAKRLLDLNGDGKADIVWENVNGSTAVWLMNGTTMTSGAGILGTGTGWSVSGVSQ